MTKIEKEILIKITINKIGNLERFKKYNEAFLKELKELNLISELQLKEIKKIEPDYILLEEKEIQEN